MNHSERYLFNKAAYAVSYDEVRQTALEFGLSEPELRDLIQENPKLRVLLKLNEPHLARLQPTQAMEVMAFVERHGCDFLLDDRRTNPVIAAEYGVDKAVISAARKLARARSVESRLSKRAPA